jgi:hypothetical protein
MTLFDQKTDAIVFDVNFWHWRAIVEAVRVLGVLPEERVDSLHEQFNGELTVEEARAVAVALRGRLLPTLRKTSGCSWTGGALRSRMTA